MTEISETEQSNQNSPAPQSLLRVQEWMQAVITHPDGVAAGIDSPTAYRALAVDPGQVEQVITRSQKLSAVDRLAVYGFAYFARLLECLAEEFSTTRHAVGEQAFQAFAFGYLQAYPSRSYTLGDLGARFPDYLAETRPADEDDSNIPNWADFVVDVATLERVYGDVFDGPGPEQMQLLTAEDLAGIAPEEFGMARLQTVPSLRVLDLRFPVHEYITAVRRGDKHVVPPSPQPTCLVVTRRDYICRRGVVTPAQGAILRSLIAGQTVAEAISSAAETPGVDERELVANVADWFRTWTAANYFVSVVTESSNSSEPS